MSGEYLSAVILAAGKGKRMDPLHSKVLQTILGEPMLALALRSIEPLCRERVVLVTGHCAEAVEQSFPNLAHVRQPAQLGTADAVRCALAALPPDTDRFLVVNGDMPLLQTATLEKFVHEAGDADVAFATIRLQNTEGYGRVVRKGGEVVAIVEQKDYNPTAYGDPDNEVNAGLYLFNTEAARQLLPLIQPSAVTGEYYITDLVALGLEKGLRVVAICMEDAERLIGVNTPAELVRAEELLRRKVVSELLARGVILHAPDAVRVSPFVEISPGAVIHGPCDIAGATVIGPGAVVEPFCHIRRSLVGAEVYVAPYSMLEDARLERSARVGPYARLRPGSSIGEAAHVGNFVELKKTVLGAHAKANHLSYLGDAEIGANVNIGAGTITCNYDGHVKHQTVIGQGAFIGSNSALVAPVEVGAEALVGAGSVITENVPADSLALARGRQVNLRRKGDDKS